MREIALDDLQIRALHFAFVNSWRQHEKIKELNNELNSLTSKTKKLNIKANKYYEPVVLALFILGFISFVVLNNKILGYIVFALFLGLLFFLIFYDYYDRGKRKKLVETLSKYWEISEAFMNTVHYMGYDFPDDLCYYEAFDYFYSIVSKDIERFYNEKTIINDEVIDQVNEHIKKLNNFEELDAQLYFYSQITKRNLIKIHQKLSTK